jgi:hypothetical protein
MKKYWLVSFAVIIAILLLSAPVMSAAPGENQGKGPIDKITFVHYPKSEAAKSGGSEPGGTGVLSSTYKYTGVRWPGNNVTVNYIVNTKVNGIAESSFSKAIQNAFTTWDDAGKGITFSGTSSDSQAGTLDTQNVVSWGPISSSNAIAVTYIWYFRNTKEIFETDTIMNSAFAWSYTPPEMDTKNPTPYADPLNTGNTGSFDVCNIMTHEAGHWLMLGDLYNTRDSYLTMYGYGSPGEIKKDTLGYGDTLGIQKAYGQ